MTEDTRLPPYLPYPRFLLGMDLTQTAKLVYTLLLGRTVLSKSHGWTDDEGKLYINFPLAEIAETLNRGVTAAKDALSELDAAGLIERRRQGGAVPNRIYVKLPDSRETDLLTAGKSAGRWPENTPVDSRFLPQMMAGNPASYIRKSKNKSKNKSKKEGVRSARTVLGRCENVQLSEAELAELQADFPALWQRYVEKLSDYMASTGRQYQSHAATIRRWIAEDMDKAAPQSYDRDYSVGEDEVV